jgi:hypothetical protein
MNGTLELVNLKGLMTNPLVGSRLGEEAYWVVLQLRGNMGTHRGFGQWPRGMTEMARDANAHSYQQNEHANKLAKSFDLYPIRVLSGVCGGR